MCVAFFIRCISRRVLATVSTKHLELITTMTTLTPKTFTSIFQSFHPEASNEDAMGVLAVLTSYFMDTMIDEDSTERSLQKQLLLIEAELWKFLNRELPMDKEVYDKYICLAQKSRLEHFYELS